MFSTERCKPNGLQNTSLKLIPLAPICNRCVVLMVETDNYPSLRNVVVGRCMVETDNYPSLRYVVFGGVYEKRYPIRIAFSIF